MTTYTQPQLDFAPTPQPQASTPQVVTRNCPDDCPVLKRTGAGRCGYIVAGTPCGYSVWRYRQVTA